MINNNSCMKENILEELKKYEFIGKIKSLPFVKELWLYGSRARGDNKDKSDIDLAVIFNKDILDTEWYEILDIVDNRDTLLGVDCVRFDKISNDDFRKNILNDKIVL